MSALAWNTLLMADDFQPAVDFEVHLVRYCCGFVMVSQGDLYSRGVGGDVFVPGVGNAAKLLIELVRQ